MNLAALLAKASPARSGDQLAGIAAESAEERVRAQMKLADVPQKAFLAEPPIPYEQDEVTRLICDTHDGAAFAPIAHLTVGELRDWPLSEQATTDRLTALARGLTPEMAAVYRHAVPLLEALTSLLSAEDWRLAPLPVVLQGRVAIGDEIAPMPGATVFRTCARRAFRTRRPPTNCTF